jgi:hypothetical protein
MASTSICAANEKSPSDGARSSKLDVLTKQIAIQIEEADRRRDEKKRWAKRLRKISIVSTAAIPVLLGLKATNPSGILQLVLNDFALAFGALATGVNSWETFYGYKELWAANTLARTRLDILRIKVDYAAANPLPDPITLETKIDELHVEFQQILAEAFSAWVGVRRAPVGQVAPLSIGTEPGKLEEGRGHPTTPQRLSPPA